MATFEGTGNSNSFGVNCKTIGVLIDGQHTDIVINEFSDRVFVVISQYNKLGSFITVCKETARVGDESGGVYKVRSILGKDDETHDVVARYIAEQTCIVKPVLFSICLKNYEFKTLEAIKNIILENKTW